MVFVHFKNDRKDVCAYLFVSDRVLMRRVSVAAEVVSVQPSLFDGIERIGDTFMSLAGRTYAAAPVQHRVGEQTRLLF